MAVELSNQPYGFTAASTPKSNAKISASESPATASKTVFGKAFQITSVTGRLCT